MARNSRLNVCLATTTRNSSKIHWQRSTIRQPDDAMHRPGIGPFPIAAAKGVRGARRSDATAVRRLASNQAFRPLGVVLQHPIPNDLKRHAADLRRPVRLALANRGQRQKPPGLRLSDRLRRPSPSAHQNQTEVQLAWRTPALATLNQDTPIS